MILKDYIKESQVIFSSTLKSKDDVFNIIAQTAIGNGITATKECMIAKLKDRELMGETGLMDGFAIPHAQDDSINKAMVVIVISGAPIPWESLDGLDARFIFGLLIPTKDKKGMHIEFLSEISTLLIEDDFKAAMLKVTNPSEVLALFN